MSVRLFILGLLNQGDSYGYEIKEKIKEWGMEEWTNIGWSSIYHALKQMKKEGLIEEKEEYSEGGRPPKTVYSILEAGKKEFLRLLRENCSSVADDKDPIYIALLFVRQLPARERIELYRKRLEKLVEAQELVKGKKKMLQTHPYGTEEVILSVERDIMLREAEIEWMKKLIGVTEG